MTTVLRPCEVTGQEEINGPMIRCERPGRLVVLPSGMTRALCEQHLAVFAADVTEIGTWTEQFDGCQHEFDLLRRCTKCGLGTATVPDLNDGSPSHCHQCSIDHDTHNHAAHIDGSPRPEETP